MRSPQSHLDVSLVRKAFRTGSALLMQRVLAKLDSTDLAQILAELQPGETKTVIVHLLQDRKRLGGLLHALPDELVEELAEVLGDELLARVIAILDLDDAMHLVRLLDDEARERVLSLVDPARGVQIARLSRYSPDSAAGHMIPRFVAVKPETTIGEAIRAVRQAAPDVPLFYLYVTDDQEQLVGVVSLGKLVKAGDETRIREVMTTHLISVAPEADQEEVARTVSRHNLLAVPVVEAGKLLGLITIDDVLDVLEREATEDMYNMAGLSAGDRVFSPPHRSLFKRLPWNVLNLGTSLMAAAVVGLFEATIDKLVALAIFMPVVAGIGGNTGNQTLTVIIRGITLGELEFSSGLRALLKETAVGVAIGALLGSIVAAVAFFWKGSAMLGLVVGLAMIINLFIAAVVGTAIPLSLKRLGLDPALGGSILVTMCTDTLGFLAFLGLATLMLEHLI